MKNITILLVEDNPSHSRLITRYLLGVESFAYQLLTAENLKATEVILKEFKVDIVLLDLTLPDGQGVNNISQVLELSPASAVITMTGIYDATIASESIQLGAQDFLVKGESDSVIFERTILNTLNRITKRTRKRTTTLSHCG